MPRQFCLFSFIRVFKTPLASARFSKLYPLPYHHLSHRTIRHSRLASTQRGLSPTGNTDRCTAETITSPATKLSGQSGRLYTIDQVLKQNENSPLRVYLANSENERFVLKNVADFQYLQEIYEKVNPCSHVRLPKDAMHEQSMFVYEFLTDDLLSLVSTTDLPLVTTKRILKDALKGLAALHDQNIVHNDIKANNILVDWRDDKIQCVQLGDIEDAAIVPDGCEISGRQLGNWMWRSPESHAGGPMNTPSDIFSFAIVCIYAVHKRLIFAVDEDELAEGEEILAHVFERQISYFADADGMEGFLKHIRKSPWLEAFRVLRDGFDKDNPRKPFGLWKDVDPVFKDLIGEMTNFDPAKRITASEALKHKWFENV